MSPSWLYFGHIKKDSDSRLWIPSVSWCKKGILRLTTMSPTESFISQILSVKVLDCNRLIFRELYSQPNVFFDFINRFGIEVIYWQVIPYQKSYVYVNTLDYHVHLSSTYTFFYGSHEQSLHLIKDFVNYG